MPHRWRTLLVLTLPVVAEQLLNLSMGLVNAGMASNLGKEAVSGISLVDTLNNVVLAFFSAVALGGTVAVAHHWGRGESEASHAVTAQALRSGTLIGSGLTALVLVLQEPMLRVLFPGAEASVLAAGQQYLWPTALSYPFLAVMLAASGALRGAGDTRTPMVANVLMNVANVALGWLFLYGLGWGVVGAGLANLIARILGAGCILLVLLRGRLRLRVTRTALRATNPAVRRVIFRVGIPTAVESLLFSGGKLLTQTFIASLGTVALASNFVANAWSTLFQLPGSALAIVCTTLVGQAAGRRDAGEARRAVGSTLLLSCLALGLVALAAFPLSPWLATFFSRDPDVVSTSSDLLRLIVVVQPFLWATSFLVPSGLRGAGDTTYPMVVTLVGMWVFRLALGWVLAFPAGLGVIGIWLAMLVDWFVRSILFLVRLRGRAWLSRDVHPELNSTDVVDRE